VRVSETAIKRCGCRSEYQDQKYGAMMRVHNHAPKKPCWRCTVCGTEKVVERREEPKK
jgi:hypothetical protein